MQEITVTNWNELNNALHSNNLFPPSNYQGGHLRSPYVFRGMVNANWGFQTSLQRLGSPIDKVERPSIRAFRRYATLGTFQNNSFWEVLSVAQHNGLPTRCLDWSISPLIAAHFATDDPSQKNQDGAIWCINLDIWKKYIINYDLQRLLKNELALIFNIKMLDEIYPDLNDLNRLRANVQRGEDPIEKSELIFFEPPSIDQRIQNQRGMFSICTDPTIDQKDFLLHYDKMYPELIKKIIITKGSKAKIRDFLDQNNINERVLYPGLPGLCKWLKRYYSPGN